MYSTLCMKLTSDSAQSVDVYDGDKRAVKFIKRLVSCCFATFVSSCVPTLKLRPHLQ